jgi:hypothetical protein
MAFEADLSENIKQSFSERLLEEDQIIDLLPLYKKVFGISFSHRQIFDKFFHRYQRIKMSCVTVTQSNAIVSFYGIICQKVVINNKEFYIGQSCDSMTDPGYGGKGLFVSLANLAYDEARKKGVNFIFGFPNETIYPLRIKKLGWQHSENIHCYKRRVRTVPVAKAVKKFPFFKKAYFMYLRIFLSKRNAGITHFDNSIVEGEVAGILHDADYFKYKSGDEKFIVKVAGVNFWLKFDGFLRVGDFEHVPDADFEKSYSQLERIATLTGCTAITFYYQQGTVNDLLLSRHFEITEKLPFGFCYLSDDSPRLQLKCCAADFDTW